MSPLACSGELCRMPSCSPVGLVATSSGLDETFINTDMETDTPSIRRRISCCWSTSPPRAVGLPEQDFVGCFVMAQHMTCQTKTPLSHDGGDLWEGAVQFLDGHFQHEGTCRSYIKSNRRRRLVVAATKSEQQQFVYVQREPHRMEDMEQKRGWFCGMIRASTKERLKKQRQQYGPLSATHKGDDKTAGSARARSAGRRPKEPMYCCQQSRIQMLATQQKREAKLKKQLLEEMADIPKATSQSEFNVVVGRAATAPATRKASGMETKRDRLQTRQGEETQMKPKKMARTQRPATAPQVQKSPPMARSKMYLRATAYASQRRLPGQTQGVVYRQANAIAGLSRPTTATSDHEIAGPVVFSSGNPMIRQDFVDQILSYDARRHAMIRQATNIPWPRPKAVDVSTKDAVLHPVYMHSSNKSEEYRDQLKTELAEQRLLRDHRERRKVPQPTPEYDSHGFPYYCTPGASRLGETNPHFEMCFLELVKNQRHPPPKRLVERPKIIAGVGAQSDAEKGHDPNWLTTRPFTAPPRRSLMNMPVTPRRDGSAPTRREPVRKEIPMPDNYKENYGRPTRSAFLRYQQSSLYRSHMALQGNDRLCVEMKKREAKVEAKRKTFSKKAMLAATLRLIRPPAHTHRTPDRETSSRSSTSEKSMTESKGEIESWSESRTKTESEIRSESRSESRAETEKRRSESSNRTKSESRSRKSSDEDIDEGTMDVVMSPRSLRRSFALGVRFNSKAQQDTKGYCDLCFELKGIAEAEEKVKRSLQNLHPRPLVYSVFIYYNYNITYSNWYPL
ncbi:hypothetical protein LSAT2_004585 [Lamellibrachia satsuma]|nr:hypothetical protein LSAT2_004585 [Lamellibrachia satsuma]